MLTVKIWILFTSEINGVTFNYNGTKMYTSDRQDNQISQFKLTTPYDVSTLSLEGTYDVSSYDEDVYDAEFSNDGSKNVYHW